MENKSYCIWKINLTAYDQMVSQIMSTGKVFVMRPLPV